MKKIIIMGAIALICASAQCGSINWAMTGNTLTRTIEGFTGNALSTTARSGIEVYLMIEGDMSSAVSAYLNGTLSSLAMGSATSVGNTGGIEANEISNSALVNGTTVSFGAIAFITIDASNAASMFGTGGGGTAGLIPQEDWSKYYGTYYTMIGTLDQLVQSAPDQVMAISFSSGLGHNMTGGWVMIPEPATAGLALAGLALLFRRKRK